MDLAEGRDRVERRALDFAAQRHVAMDGDRLDLIALQHFRRLAGHFQVDVGDDDVHAGAAERVRHAEADAAGAARDEGGLALEILHHAARSRSLVSVSRASNRAISSAD